MATWLVHLRLAENMLEMLDGLDAQSLAVGSIAPDCGMPDEKRENFSPSKTISHFIVPTDEDAWRIVDLTFYREYLKPVHAISMERFSFLLGYFLHLVTDNLWNQWIAGPTIKAFDDKFSEDDGFIWTVKYDWYGLDIEYLQNHPDSFFRRVFSQCEFMPEYALEFMPVEGLCIQLDQIKAFYADEKRIEWAAKRPGIYLTEPDMNRFVNDATQYLFSTYRLLFDERIDITGYKTIMELLPVSLE